MLYAMLYGTVPFKANNMSDLHKLIMKGKYSLKEDISESARSMLKGLLERDPSMRLTSAEVLAHPWMTNIDDTRKTLYPSAVLQRAGAGINQERILVQ